MIRVHAGHGKSFLANALDTTIVGAIYASRIATGSLNFLYYYYSSLSHAYLSPDEIMIILLYNHQLDGNIISIQPRVHPHLLFLRASV